MVSFRNSLITLELKGSVDQLVEVAQIVAWISSALRLLPQDQPPTSCLTTITQDSEGLVLRQAFTALKLDSQHGGCWVPLLPRAVIAEGFPIPDRHSELGLEIPLDMLSALIGGSAAAEYCGGILIKGFSAMLVPVKRTEHGIQWHLVSSNDEETPLSYLEGVGWCPERANTSEVPMDLISTSRTFVGWCREVISCLGRNPKDFDYAIIRNSHAEPPTSRITLDNITVGFQQIATAEANFKFMAPQSPAFFKQHRRYAAMIRLTKDARVLLYDSDDKRAWLVTADEVILHMAQYRLVRSPAMMDGQVVNIKATGPAAEALQSNASLTLEEGYTFQDMVKNTWAMLEFLQADLEAKKKDTSPLWKNNFLSGYEFRACAEEASSFTIRQLKLDRSAADWASLVRSINALVLFGRGFGELLKPGVGGEIGLCPRWRTLPRCRDLMATSVKVLQQLYDEVPAEGPRRYLASSKLEWHRGDSLLFESCIPPLDSCYCQRAQRIVPGYSLTRLKPPGDLAPDGGVVFGDCRKEHKLMKRMTSTGQTVQTAGHVTIQLILYGEAQGSLGRGLDDPVDQDVMVNNVGHGLVMCQTALDITNVIIAEEREARHQ
ncbi:hypothetical protein AUP68_15388 [Ilyonectria robusta]